MIRDFEPILGEGFPSAVEIKSASGAFPDMGARTINLQCRFDGQTTPDFTKSWEFVYKGNKYIMPLRKPQGSKDNEKLSGNLELPFQHWAEYQLQRYFFFELYSVLADTVIPDKYIASVELNLENFCILYLRVLEYWYGDKITLDIDQATIQNATSDVQKVEISYSNMWEVLLKTPEIYGVHFRIEPNGDADHYVIKIRHGSQIELSHIFEYGFKGGLLKVERQVQNPDIRNIILGRGGDKNLPYRYFKDVDPNNPSFKADPDWIPELAQLPFTQLHGATFRSYIRGWKAKHYGGTTTAADCYAPWAWQKGYTDEKFAPVEFVYDEESIAFYGELWGALDDNDNIYPSIQGRVRAGVGRVDEVVAVEPIISDDYEAKSEKESQICNVNLCASESKFIKKNSTEIVKLVGGSFTIPEGLTGSFDYNYAVAEAYDNPHYRSGASTAAARGGNGRVKEYDKFLSATVKAVYFNGQPSDQVLTAGTYTWSAEVEVENTSDKDLTATVNIPKPQVIASDIDDEFAATWCVWIKDVFNTPKPANKTSEVFAAEVWDPLLGDHLGNDAALFFTSGMLSTSEDYKFLLAKRPEYDPSQSINVQGVGTVQSMWKLTLQKSDADLEATNLWLPSTMRQASAGDRFAFEGIELPHQYVLMAEEEIDNAKKQELEKVKEIKPTWVVSLDKVRISKAQFDDVTALIDQLVPGAAVRLHDPRFILNAQGTPAAYETLYITNVNIEWREPTDTDPALIPDVEITLSDKYEVAASTVSRMQSEIDALTRQVGSLGNIEQLIRAVSDKLYLRKDGLADISMSPTQFFSLLTSGDFRNGMVGGAGWGFFRDANGNWVLETDRVNVRQEMQVNSLVINQVKGQGGTIVEGAAVIEAVTEVIEDNSGYYCYFDTKNGTVFNQFRVDDVAYCHRYVPTTAADNAGNVAFGTVKFYKRRVIAVGDNYIKLSKTEVNGSGIPTEGDAIIHYGNYTDLQRQYVKVRDVIGGGYERYLEDLNSVNATGTEYYFVGRQAGMYDGKPRWFIGNRDKVHGSGKGDGSFIEYIDRQFNLNNVRLSLTSTIGNTTIDNYVNDAAQTAADAAKAELQSKIDDLQDQVDGVVEAWSYPYTPTASNYPADQWTTEGEKNAHVGDVFYNIQPAYNEDGSANPDAGKAWRWSQGDEEHGNAYHWHPIADSDAVRALQLAQMSVTGTDVLYKQHTSSSEAPELPTVDTAGNITNYNGWSTKAPTWVDGKFMWQTTYVKKGDGSATFSTPTCISGGRGPQGVPGPTGYTWIRYADDAQGNGISNNPTGKAYIGFAYNKTTATESNNPLDYTWSEIKGEQGIPGAKGADGKTYYTWIQYSDNANGNPMYQQPNANTKYIGIAVNKETETESNNPSDYTWSLFKGADGTAAKLVYINADATAFMYKDNFATLVEPQTIKLSATLQGTTGYQWAYMQQGAESFTNFQVGKGQTLTISQNQLSTLFPDNARTVLIRCTSGDVYDEITIAKISSGADGDDAYTILMPNQSHIFEGDTEKAVAASTSSEVIAYKGATKVAATIGTITGMPAGMTVAISNNGTTSAKFTVNVTTALTTKQGTLTVPVTVDDKTFTQIFSWSLSLQGKDGRGIVSVVEEYAIHTSGTTAPADSAFSTGIKAMTDAKRYLWNREKTTYTDNTSETTDAICIGVKGQNGVDGATVTQVINYYLASEKASGVTTAASEGWVTDASQAVTSADKPYLWNYEVTKWNKGADTSTDPHIVGTFGSSFTDNLLLKSDRAIVSEAAKVADYTLAETPIAGETYTFTLWGTLAASKIEFQILNSGYNVILAILKKVSEGVYSATFQWKNTVGSNTANDTFVRVVAYPSSAAGTSSIVCAKLEKGANANPQWTPNSKEMQTPTFTEQYYLSTSNTELSGGSWVDNEAPQWEIGKYIWTRTKIEYATGEVTYTDAVCNTGAAGAAAPNLVIKYSATGGTAESEWHPTYTAGDIWMKTSNDGGVTWSPAMPFVGSGYSNNLLLNSDFKDGTKHWGGGQVGLKITLDTTKTRDGRNSIKFNSSGMSVDSIFGFQQRATEESNPSLIVSAGNKVTASIWTFSDDISTIDRDAYMAIECYNSSGNQITYSEEKVSIKPTKSNEWQKVVHTVTLPANTYKLRALIYIVRNGRFWINSPKFEIGANTDPQWTPAASEMVGQDGKWRKFQWALGSETAVTGTWQDAPMNAPTGQYVWMRSGIVVPPATNPTTWETATRLTGDKGQSGDSVYQLDLSDEMMPMPCDAAGNVVGAYLTSQASVFKGGTEVASGITYSIAQQTGVSATITTSGLVTPSNLTADRGTIVVQAGVAGITLQTTLSLYKVKPGANYSNNLLLNSDFKDNTENWRLDTNVTRDTTKTLDGRNSIKTNQSGLTTDAWRGVHYNKIPVQQGDRFTFSGWWFTDNLSTFDSGKGFTIIVEWFNANGTRIDYSFKTIIPSKANEWQQVSVISNVAPTQAVSVSFAMYLTRNGRIWFNGLKAEHGANTDPQWTPAASEMIGEDGQPAVVYRLGFSADSISRNALGQLSTTSITVRKYKITGASPRELTTEKKIRYQRIGVDTGYTEVQSGVSSTNISVPNDPALTAIMVQLLNEDNTEWDSERVPLIQDGTELTENLVLNSDANISTSAHYISGFFTSEELVSGETYTFTVWGELGSDRTAFRVSDQKNTGGSMRVLNKVAEGVYSVVGIWNPDATVTRKNFVSLYQTPTTATSTSRLDKIKVEKGANYAPVWTQSSHEVDYLKAALRESGSIEGGLALLSLIQMGFTNSSGTYETTAGVNGIRANGDDLAFWAGGKMIDPEKQPNASNLPTFGVRHDGTAFAAGNTIKFLQNLIKVGEYIRLDNSGLKMIIDNVERLFVGNATVNGSGVLSQKTTVEISGSIQGTLYGNHLYYAINSSNGVYSTYYSSETIGDYFHSGKTVTLNKTIGAGQTIKFSQGAKFSMTLPSPISSSAKFYTAAMPKLVVTLKLGSEEIGSKTILCNTNQEGGELIYDLSGFSIKTTKTLTNPKLTFKLTNFTTSLPIGWNLCSNVDINVGSYQNSMKVIATIPDSERKNKTILGANGLELSWGDTHQYQQNGLWGVRVGEYGLQVRTDGIYIMEDGETPILLKEYIKNVVRDAFNVTEK